MRPIKQNRYARLSGALAFILAFSAAAHAQTITTGVLEGVVTDQNQLPLADVLVAVTPTEGGSTRSTVTNRDGVYRFALMPAGRYQLTVERLGYRPAMLTDVSLAANARVPIAITLTEAPPPVEAAERLVYHGAAAGSRAGASQLLSFFALDEVPWERREATELARLASASTASLEVEGLPAWLSAVRFDGVPYTSARHPELAPGSARAIAVPVSTLSLAELVTGEADAEWGGAAAGTLSAATRHGGNTFRTRAFASWAGNALRSSDLFETAELSGNSIWGGLLLDGAVIRDTAHMVVGVEARRLQTPLASVWNLDTGAADALVSAGNARGAQLTPYTLPYSFESTTISAFGRFDWQLANNSRVRVSAALGNSSPGSTAFGLAAAAFPELTASARDLLLSASLASSIGTSLAHELRVGFGNSTLEHDAEAADGALLPATMVTTGALIGTAPRLLGTFKRSDLTAEQSLQIPAGDHQVKIGLGVGLGLHDVTYGESAAGQFTFGGAAELAQAQGVFVQTVNAAPQVDFSTLNANAYLQDSWLAAPGLQLVAAVRVDMETLPHDDVKLDQAWLTATGLDNTAFDSKAISISPRFGLIWDVGMRGNVLVRVNGGRYANNIDPTVLMELLTGDGDVTVRRGFGALGSWPATPSTNVTSTGTRLSLLGPDFRGAHSDRVSFGLSSRVGSLGTLHLSGAYRKTSSLPRRSDLNLLADPVAEDQYGRALYGTLSQSGQLLTAGASNRRFAGYDMVSGIAADGTSEYRGFTIALEPDAGKPVSVFGSYTFSQTTDNWPARRGLRAELQMSPFPDATTDEWLDGTSDFDLPHRLVAGLQLRPQVALQPRVTAIYRFQSGYPFTPGFRDGVDANGDGSDSNDPAFIDTGLAGMAELVGEWDCLSGQGGQFAERNSCRSDGTHELDLRLGLSLLNSARTSAQLFVEGLNLMDARFDIPDRALVLVDATRTLQVNQTQRTVDVPLIANPNFGKPLLQRGSGRLLRIGLQVNH